MKSIVKNRKANDWYISLSENFEAKLNGNDNSFLKGLRNDALKQLAVTDFPTLKTEEWKYTNLNRVLNKEFVHASSAEKVELTKEDVDSFKEEDFDYHLLVFVNGIFSEEFSDVSKFPKNIFVGSLNDGIQSGNEFIKNYLGKQIENKTAFDHLNDAYMLDGAFVIIPDGAILEKPIQILNISGHTKELTFNTPRNLIMVGKNSQASIFFKYAGIGEKKYFTNSITEIFVDENALVNIYKIELEDVESYHIERTEIYQKANSVFNHYNFTFGGSLVRNDINSKMDDENIECHLNGLYIGRDDQHFDNHTFIDHAKPNCYSNELYKGILDDKAHGVFSGKILVDKDAQKTNAYQSNKTILLSKDASIDTKPQLEIYADDVKCSHGATVGHLDETALFYILSRGIPEEKAKSMLITAFAEDVVSKIKIKELKEKLNHLIFEHLNRVEV
ncbi:Iron-sulfur cluster assembly protein SufD [hydrothermal vent metagenome]|uniref:Iron-sulfur cluster assembly protein SufD n=1 Tax=hydrothermal vent metagenome TaxID=652676 RepID=A0A3B1D820_9ZZZZ